ncbi:MAG: hypothetical protein M3Y87_33280, partial [Myxococcota bacterium]|nr:hypothetical protein [Myxococcota bacterium]
MRRHSGILSLSLAAALAGTGFVVLSGCERDEPQFRPATLDDNAGEPIGDRAARPEAPPTRDPAAAEPPAEGAL